jgi:hypothetical protein
MPSGATLVGAMDTAAQLSVGLADASGVGTYSTACTNLNGTASRAFDVAFDTAGSKGIIAYWNQVAGAMRYRTHNGTSLSGEASVGLVLGADYAQIVSLTPKGTGSEMVLLVGTNNPDLWASIWNGASWTAGVKLMSGLGTTSYQPFDAAYESLSGRIIAAYCDSSTVLSSRIYSAGSWGAAGPLGSSLAMFRWIRLASRPGTNEIFAIGIDTSNIIWAAQWNGSAWGAISLIGWSSGYSDRRPADILCSPDGSQVMLVYGLNSSTLFYRTWTGSTFGAQQIGPGVGGAVMWARLAAGTSGADLRCAVATSARALVYTSWNGSAWSAPLTITSALSIDDDRERFALVPGDGKQTIKSWAVVQP